MISDKELEYLIKLQPFFKNKLKDIKVNDFLYNIKTNFLFTFSDYESTEWRKTYEESLNIIRIPQIIDLENSERGLIGMIVGFSRLEYDNKYYKWYIKCTVNGWYKDYPEEDTSLLAILKAISIQENMDI